MLYRCTASCHSGYQAMLSSKLLDRPSSTACALHDIVVLHLCDGGGEDVGVTGIDNGHGGATEHLTASSTQLNVLSNRSVCVALRSRDYMASSQGSFKTLLAQCQSLGACVLVDLRCQRSGGRQSWKAWRSTRAQTCEEEECCQR